jgi:hypothetical protein
MSKAKVQMSNQAQNPNTKKKYDLEERTAQFGFHLAFELWHLTFDAERGIILC